MRNSRYRKHRSHNSYSSARIKMKILVINSGSSSIKYKLFEMPQKSVLSSGLVEKIGEVSSNYSNHHDAIVEIFNEVGKVDAIAHRVVHGADNFSSAVMIDDEVIKIIRELIPLAPLHNPPNLDAIEVAIKEYQQTPQIAVFDTAFHQSMPKESYIYALPYELYEKYKVRRYGFHGTSHGYLAAQCAKILDKNMDELNVITLHLGNGSSACAIKNGKSIDTSMGMSPLEGLVMGTRCGDIDSEVIFYISQKTGMSLNEIDVMLNKRSGLKGICGINDMREICALSANGDELATLALDIFTTRIKKYIGSYIALLGRVDAIVFSGGIGEHSDIVREKALEGLDESFGIRYDKAKNSSHELEISIHESKIKLFIIATNEELEIASEAYKLLI